MENLKLITKVDFTATLMSMKVGVSYLVQADKVNLDTVKNTAARLGASGDKRWKLHKLSFLEYSITRIK